jgi:hypothetical protein
LEKCKSLSIVVSSQQFGSIQQLASASFELFKRKGTAAENVCRSADVSFKEEMGKVAVMLCVDFAAGLKPVDFDFVGYVCIELDRIDEELIFTVQWLGVILK